jgi:hypothetical protein
MGQTKMTVLVDEETYQNFQSQLHSEGRTVTWAIMLMMQLWMGDPSLFDPVRSPSLQKVSERGRMSSTKPRARK